MQKTVLPAVDLLARLRLELPDISFHVGETFMWSPRHQRVSYSEASLSTEDGTWALLHEAGHAILRHADYRHDIELVSMEAAAWDAAIVLGKKNGITISSSHIQDCLDTYRDWLHRRSTCPGCGITALQHDQRTYRCHNCLHEWGVSDSRFCRPYRKNKAS